MPSKIVKTAGEQAKIRKAAAIIDDVYDTVLGFVREGVTEIEVAAKIKEEVLRLGGEDVSFDTIVAFGASAAEPHHVPGETVLHKGVLVKVDMGAVYQGYCSDFTRTFAFGEVSGEAKRIYEIVKEAQARAMSAVQEGARCADIDNIARDYITEQGYGDKYIHGTGHGVGTEIHEAPTLKGYSEEVLADGMVVTVEPGIYLEGELGVRIEDMLIVGDPKPLSRHQRELIVIDAD